MAMIVQHLESSVEFYFASVIEDQIHEGFLQVKEAKAPIAFRKYSFICHLILFQNETKWTRRMKLYTQERGIRPPVQNWCYIWDNMCTKCDFVVFRDYFVVRLIATLGYSTPRLPKSLMSVMSPMQYKRNQGYTHNYADWFLMPHNTIFRVYGCNQLPHILPKFVPARIYFLEFMCQMLWMEHDLMRNQKKGTFFPNLTVFEEFFVGSDMLEELQRFMRVNYPLKSGKERVCDPKGQSNMIKRTLVTKRVISHVFEPEEDVIRNLVYFDDVFQTRKRWIMMIRRKDQKKEKNKSFKGFFVDEPNLLKMMRMTLGKFDEFYKRCQDEGLIPLPTPQKPSHEASKSHTPPPSPTHPSPPSPTHEPHAKKQKIESLVDYGSSYDKEQEAILTLTKMTEVVEKQKIQEPHDPKIKILEEGADEIQDDERVVASLRFMENENFIYTNEFKYFWIKMKMKHFNERLKINLIGADESKQVKIQAQTLEELNIHNINVTAQEARELVLKSDMMIIPRMELSKVFLLDYNRAQDDPMLVVVFDSEEGVSGIAYNPTTQNISLQTKKRSQGSIDSQMWCKK